MNEFLDKIKARARQNRKTIVLAEGEEPRTLRAAEIILKEKISNVILIGNKDKIARLVPSFVVEESTIVDPGISSNFDDFSLSFYEMRKHKGMTEAKARDIVCDPLYFGIMLVKKGLADGMVAGAVNATADVLRPALQILRTAPGAKLVSSFFVVVVPNCNHGQDGVFVYSDAGLNESPDVQALANIAISSARSFKSLVQAEPIVAMLSYSSKGSAKGDLVKKVADAASLAKSMAPYLNLDGELQADAAIVPDVCKLKAPGSSVAGRANVLIFPDLNSGNISYKLTERLAGAKAYGPITQGILRPVNDLSRGCSPDDIVGVAAITCVQAQEANRENSSN